MTFTVIIPCYKQEQYLEDAVASAAKCKGVEMISLIDDASPTWPMGDNLFDSLEASCRGVDLWLMHNVKNEGLSYARNRGFANADSDWVLPLDADDVLVPAAFDSLPDIGSDVGFVYGSYLAFSETTQYHVTELQPDATLDSMLFSPWLPPCALVRKSAWEAVKAKNGTGYDPEVSKLGGFEDWLFWLELMALGWKGHYTYSTMWRYRRYNKGGSMRERALQNIKAIQGYISDKMRRLYGVHFPA